MYKHIIYINLLTSVCVYLKSINRLCLLLKAIIIEEGSGGSRLLPPRHHQKYIETTFSAIKLISRNMQLRSKLKDFRLETFFSVTTLLY